MKYYNIHEAIFLKRKNRFVVTINIKNKIADAHLPNTGRLGELLVPNSICYVTYNPKETRKTDYTIISIIKEDIIFQIDSTAPNKVFYESLIKGNTKVFGKVNKRNIKREASYNKSRIDFYLKNEKMLIEVKGVTLDIDNVAYFPDAITKRGTKHIKELISWVNEGNRACLVFIIQYKGAVAMKPNYNKDIEFAKILKEAKKQGVSILAYDTYVTRDEIKISNEIEVII